VSGSRNRLEAMRKAAAGLSPRHSPAKALPRLLCLTDPLRTPDPAAILEQLPPDVAVIFRAFGAADAARTGHQLARIAKARGLTLLVGADTDLALAIGADGLHLPERLADDLPALRRRHPDWILTAAAHSLAAARKAADAGADAVLVSPVFDSNSPSAGAPLGVETFSALVAAVEVPVYALGGVTPATATSLADSGAAGLAGIEAFLAD